VAVLAALAGLVLAGPAPALAAAPRTAASAGCPNGAADPGDFVRDVPWAQHWFDPDRIGPLATGSGQVVAVIDTGTDGNRSQLSGRVLAGWDELRQQPDAGTDCSSHGTAVASLIGAQRDSQVGLRGLAPGAKILPVRVTDTDPANAEAKDVGPAVLAAAVHWAATHGATVIDVSPTTAQDDPRLRKAVRSALADGIVVVAAAGDRHDDTKAQFDPPAYPAAYPGVIGVGAVDDTFTRLDSSDVGSYVAVTAPGAQVLGATRIAGFQQWNGTSIAAGFVAATAALVRQAQPGASPAQVSARITTTADPAAFARGTLGYGAGVLDPYRAVAEVATSAPASVPAGLAVPRIDPAAVARSHWWHHTRVVAGLATGGVAVLLVLLLSGVTVLRRGARRAWRPERATYPRTVPDPEDDEDADLFAVPPAEPARE
jgi:type VII secretion-associated serine protease mycosin